MLQQAIDLHRSGRLPEAKAAYRSILEEHPGNADASALLGVVLTQTGATAEGIEQLRGALRRTPGEPMILLNLGVALMGVGDLSEAEVSIQRAVEGAPLMTEGWLNLGAVRHARGDLAGAAIAFRRALACDPDSADARMSLGAVLREQGDIMGALDAFWAHVQRGPDDARRWTAFVCELQTVRFGGPEAVERVLPVLIACLLEDGVDHQRLAWTTLRVLRQIPEVAHLLDLATEDPAALEAALEDPDVWAVVCQPTVRLALQRMLVPDIAWERLFTAVRRHLARLAHTQASAHVVSSDPGIAFDVARQCFHNGYAWSYSAGEQEAVEGLVREMSHRDLGEDALDLVRVAVLASYVPLIEWDRAEDVLRWSETADSAPLAALVAQQIVEPVVEDGLRSAIPTWGESVSTVSGQVREMYEEHPYPRWMALDSLEARPAGTVLRSLLPGSARYADSVPLTPHVLVAGCGTGKQLLDVAHRFEGAQVVGVDLSLSSLAYAARKAEDFGTSNVSMVQADILSLGDWDRCFDMVHCCGVLHHMEDPMAGWRVITDLLRPGGVMSIALYSDVARRDVVEAQRRIGREELEGTPEVIRQARDVLADTYLHREDSLLLERRDFYSLPECRDLLFHVQEHRFTLPRIAECTAELGLEFLGFEFDGAAVLRRFRERFPEPDAERSLECWHTFETENPDTFAGMYQFWLGKPN